MSDLHQEFIMNSVTYSSIAQSGYFLLGILAVGASELALPSIILFAAAYAAMNLGAFAVAASTGRTLNDFDGLGRAQPLIGLAMVIFLLSLVGIPPLAGFVGKFLLFAAVIDVQYTWVAVVAIINSVLSLAVYLRLVVPMYRQGNVVVARTDIWLKAVLIIALTVTLLLGVFAQVFVGPFA